MYPQNSLDDSRPADRSVGRLMACGIIFEALLGVVAILVGWLLGIFTWPEETVSILPPASSVAAGLVATLPLVVMLYVVERVSWAPLARLHELVTNQVLPMFAGASLSGLLVLSAAAGVGEELLFRGLLQTWIARSTPCGTGGAIVVAAVLFGLLHRLSWTYAVLATLVGCYLGWLFVFSGSLWVPIIVHALYDFFAILYLRRGQDKTSL